MGNNSTCPEKFKQATCKLASPLYLAGVNMPLRCSPNQVNISTLWCQISLTVTKNLLFKLIVSKYLIRNQVLKSVENIQIFLIKFILISLFWFGKYLNNVSYLHLNDLNLEIQKGSKNMKPRWWQCSGYVSASHSRISVLQRVVLSPDECQWHTLSPIQGTISLPLSR